MKKQLNPAHAHFEPVVNHWPKVSGELPAPDLFNAVFALGLRPGGKHTLACAMYMRDAGATDAEVIAAARLLNAPHKRNQRQDVLHNYAFDGKTGLCGLVGLCRRDMNIAKRDWAKVYKMTLTAKGEKQVAKWQAAQAAAPVATPVKGKAKAKKAKVTRKPRAKAAPVAEATPVISDNSVLIPAQPVDTPQA
jgi:hypothetical protein